jgi:hypothetical protein
MTEFTFREAVQLKYELFVVWNNGYYEDAVEGRQFVAVKRRQPTKNPLALGQQMDLNLPPISDARHARN